MSHAHVTSLEYETNQYGAEVTIRTNLVGDAWIHNGPVARAQDLQPDVADALREWLKKAPSKEKP